MHLAFINGMHPLTILVILIIALLIFGKRLPEVARSLGKGVVEFKKGMTGIEDEIQRPVSSLPPPSQVNPVSHQPQQTGSAPGSETREQLPYSGPYPYHETPRSGPDASHATPD